MVERRFYAFCGNLPALIPMGVGATAYSGLPLTGAVLSLNGDSDWSWPTRHLLNNGGLGVLAYIWNRIGPARTKYNPSPSSDLYYQIAGSNGHTDPYEGGSWPSAWAGISEGFLLGAHGRPWDAGRDNPLTRDPTFSINCRSLGNEVVPVKETRGLVYSITTVSGSTIEVTLSNAHGEAGGSTFTVWMYGFKPGQSLIPDPQLTGKFVATAHATNPNVFQVTLPSPWTGVAGLIATGIAIVPYYKITGITNPSGNIVRVTLNHPFDGSSWDSLLYNLSDYGDFWIGDVTGTASPLDGMRNVLRDGARFAPTNTASTNVSFTSGTKTIARSSGAWDRTPAPGEKLYITGAAGGPTTNNKVVTVVSATASTIVVSETLTTESAGPSVTIHTLHILQFDYGAAVNLAGWAGDGFVFRQDKAHPVFLNDCGGDLYLGRMRQDIAAYQANLTATILAANPWIGTVGDADSAIVCSFGDADMSAAVSESDYQGFCFQAWPQSLRDIYAGMRAAVVASLTVPPAANDIAILNLRTTVDGSQEFGSVASWAAASVYGYQQAEIWAVANTPKSIIVEPGDLEPHNGRWPVGVDLLKLGLKTWDTLEQLNTPPATLAETVGIPVYVLLGQSQTVGAVVCAVTLPQPGYKNGDPDLNGEWYDSTYQNVIRDRGCLIWHEGRATMEEYAPAKNAVSYSDRLKAIDPALGDWESVPPLGSVVGPEASLVLKLSKRHPEGFALFKLAVGGCSLQFVNPIQRSFAKSSGDLWVDIETWWGKFLTWCWQHGRVPDVRAVFFDQGEGDATVTSGYGSALTQFIADIRALLTTTTSSRAPLPFIIGRVQTHSRQSTYWAEHLPAIQAAQDQVAAAGVNVVSVSMQGLPIATDDVHRTWHATLIAGQRLADALDLTTMSQDGQEVVAGAGVNPETTHGEASSTSGSSGGGASAAGAGGSGNASAAAPESVGSTTTIASGTAVEVARQIVAACDQAILDGLTVLSYTVNGRTFTRSGLTEILRTRTIYVQALARSAGSTRRQGTLL